MKRIVLTLCIFGLCFVLTACGGGGGGGGGGVAPIAQVPAVVATSPLPGATGVATNATIQVIFSEAMDAVPTAAAFGIAPAVAGSAAVVGTILTFTPSAALPVGTNYTVTIAATARGAAGVTMSAPHIFTFRTDGASASGPAKVTDLAILQGPAFGNIRLSFTAPAAGSGGAVASYQIRYSGSAITDANFAQATALPAGIALPAPPAAGTAVTLTVDALDTVTATRLVAVEPGDPLHFALRAVDASGGTAAVSNGAATVRPWAMTLRFERSALADQLTDISLGQQAGATDATDGFDQEKPPVDLPGTLVAKVTLAGRPEALLRDIRGAFAAAGEQTLFTVELSGGAANESVDLEFPAFQTATPFLFTYRAKIGDAAEADITGSGSTFLLDGTGRRTIVVRVAN